MKKQQIILPAAAAIGILVLILDGKTAVEGVQEGIGLCISTLIPSLFPFFFFSSILTGSLIGQPLKFLAPITAACGIPAGAESLLAVGILGGYPVGAQNVASAYRHGQITRHDAERMLPFCNNAGPSFIFGMIGSMFSCRWIPWLLWCIHITSALGAALAAYEKPSLSTCKVIGRLAPAEALERSVRSMATVCGWVILFRMVLSILNRWFLWMFNDTALVLLSGLLELSNGCILLHLLRSEGLRLTTASVLLAFGGLCVTMQTASAASGLSLKYYISGKMIQGCFSVLLSMAAQLLLPPEQRFMLPLPVLCLSTVLPLIIRWILLQNKKTSSFPGIIGV